MEDGEDEWEIDAEQGHIDDNLSEKSWVVGSSACSTSTSSSSSSAVSVVDVATKDNDGSTENDGEDEDWVVTNNHLIMMSNNINQIQPPKIVSEDYYPPSPSNLAAVAAAAANNSNSIVPTATTTTRTKISLSKLNDEDEFPTLKQATATTNQKKQKNNNNNSNNNNYNINNNCLKNNYYQSLAAERKKEELIEQINEIEPQMTHSDIENILTNCREQTLEFVVDYIEAASAVVAEERARYKKANFGNQLLQSGNVTAAASASAAAATATSTSTTGDAIDDIADGGVIPSNDKTHHHMKQKLGKGRGLSSNAVTVQKAKAYGRENYSN